MFISFSASVEYFENPK